MCTYIKYKYIYIQYIYIYIYTLFSNFGSPCCPGLSGSETPKTLAADKEMVPAFGALLKTSAEHPHAGALEKTYSFLLVFNCIQPTFPGDLANKWYVYVHIWLYLYLDIYDYVSVYLSKRILPFLSWSCLLSFYPMLLSLCVLNVIILVWINLSFSYLVVPRLVFSSLSCPLSVPIFTLSYNIDNVVHWAFLLRRYGDG